jgi:hypothetical protein
MNAIAPPLNFEHYVDRYVKLRDKLKEIKDAHKAQLEPFNSAMETLEGMLLNHLNQVGADSVKTGSGTVYKTMKKSATVADRKAFWTYMVTQGKFELMDYKANPVAIESFINEMAEKAKLDPTIVPCAPPGVNYTMTYEVGIRRK